MIKNLLPFLGCSAIVLIAIYGIKGDGKKPAGVHIEKVFEDLDENNSFLTLAEDISKEFNIDLEKARDIVGHIEGHFYDDLGEVCQDYFADMQYEPDYDQEDRF